MPERCNVTNGMALEADCPDCPHPVGDHDYPSGRCRSCLSDRIEEAEAVLAQHFPLEIAPLDRKDDQLTDAIGALTEAVLHLADIIGRDRVF